MTPEHPERRETDWLYQELRTLRQDFLDSHRRLRSDMNAGFDRIRLDVLEKHAERIEDHGLRIVRIEEARKFEEKAAAKRGTWAGLLAASGLTAMMKLAEAMWRQ